MVVAAVFADTVFVVVGVIVIDDGYEVIVERVFVPVIVLALVLSLFHICLSALRSKKKKRSVPMVWGLGLSIVYNHH